MQDNYYNSKHYWIWLLLPLLIEPIMAQDPQPNLTENPTTETAPNSADKSVPETKEAKPETKDAATEPSAEPALPPSTGNLMSLTAPVKKNGMFIGEAEVKVREDGSGLLVNAEHITALFKADFKPEALQKLEALPKGKFITAEEAKALGLDVRFDMADAAVLASLAGSAKNLTELSLTGGTPTLTDTNTGRAPQGISGYVNIFATTQANDFGGKYKFDDPTFAVDGAIHIAPFAHMTVEGRGSVNADKKFERGDVRALWRSTDRNNIWELGLGDVGMSGISFMEGASLRGLEYSNFDTRNRNKAGVSAVGNRQFFLDRPAVARLLIDGKETQRYNLDPGPYNVKDFPLTDGANNITFIIEDDQGEIERINFNVFSDSSLLAPGEYRYGTSVGKRRKNQTIYNADQDKTLFSGFFETGLTPNFAIGAGVQGGEKAKLGVATAKWGTPIGRFDFEAGFLKHNEGSNGKAGKITWRNTRSNNTQYRAPSLAFSAAYQNEFFNGLFDDKIFNEEEWRFDAGYSQTLFNNVSLGLSASHSKNRTKAASSKTTLSLGKSFNRWGLGTSVSYRKEEAKKGWEGSVSLTYDFDKRARITSRYERDIEGEQRTELDIASDYTKGLKVGNGMLDYNIGLSLDKEKNGSIRGGFDYKANRFELSATHANDIKSLTDGSVKGQRTTVRAGVALAFAEGKVAFGRPIRDSFAIFYPHATIANKRVKVGNMNEKGVYEAQSDRLGPLLANIGSSTFQSYNIRFDVDDLPEGYDLGTGLTNLAPRYKSGFAVEVGSAYNVIGTGTLLDSYGEPVKLLLGSATEDKPKGRSVDAFTDDSGRLSVAGLGAGRWKLEMFAEEPIIYVLNVPAKGTGIIDLGTLKPSAAQTQKEE